MAPFDKAAVKDLAERNGDPDWLVRRRLDALERFRALPWPDPSSEAWRYTTLEGFDLEHFSAASPAPRPEELPPHHLTTLPSNRSGIAVEMDGRVVSRMVGEGLADKGVIFASMAEAAELEPDVIRDALGSAGASESDEKLVALATAFASPGAVVYVPKGVELALPLQTVHWISRAGTAIFPRTLIIAEEGASVTCIDLYHSGALTDGGALAVAGVEIIAHPASNVSYLAVQDWGPGVWHFNVQRAVVRRDASVRSLAASLGGRMSRSLVESILEGEGSYSEMLGVYFGDGFQHFDHRSLQEHKAPHTKSELYYKGALKGHSTAVYSGLIHIAKDAQKTDSWQGNRNLILSDNAKADSIPYLEIEANDVRCAHGASVGPPDEDVLFYLQSRGLDHEQGEKLVVKGFFQEVLDRVRVDEVRQALEAAVARRLEGQPPAAVRRLEGEH